MASADFSQQLLSVLLTLFLYVCETSRGKVNFLSFHVSAIFTSRCPCNLWTLTCVAVLSQRLCLIWFAFLGAELCLRLPSDSTSQWTPLLSANGWRLQTPIVDFHHQDNCHARHTTKKRSRYSRAFFLYKLKSGLIN